MATIKIPTPLRQYTGSHAEVTASGETVQEALQDLVTQYPDLKSHLFDGDTLRSFVNVFLGEEDIRFLQGPATPIGADDRLRIVPAIAGGSPAIAGGSPAIAGGLPAIAGGLPAIAGGLPAIAGG